MSIAIDNLANFAESTITAGFDATATQITVGDPDRFPAAPFLATIHNSTAYPGGASQDPDREIVRVTVKTGATFTLQNVAGVRQALEGTTPHAHNTAGAVYKLTATATAGLFQTIAAAGIDVGDEYCWITEHGAVGDGTTDDRAAFQAALTAGRTFIVVPSGTYRFASAITFGTDVVLQLLPGAVLAPDITVTVTINGDILAGNWDWQGGAGSIAIGDRAVLQHRRWNGTDEDGIEIRGNLYVEVGKLRVDGTAIYVGSVVPASGTWSTGDFVFNSAPSTDEVIGWRCTAGGTPGTWETIGKGTQWKKIESSAFEPTVTTYHTEIAHGLGSTPSPGDCIASVYISSGYNAASVPAWRQIYVETSDGTNVKVYAHCLDAGTAGNNVKLVVWIKTA